MIRRLIVALLCAMTIVAGLLTYVVVRHRDQQGSLAGIRPSGIPASVSTPLADLMQLSPVPARPAPGFTLTDQAGHVLRLASFRGRAVVLEFMDPHCTDICPIVSQEFIDAYRDLGRSAARAVFIAVNVNPYFHGVADVAAYSAEHQLAAIPSWHFLTGPVASLKPSGAPTPSRFSRAGAMPTSSTPQRCSSSTPGAASATSPPRWLTTPRRARPTSPRARWPRGVRGSPRSPGSSVTDTGRPAGIRPPRLA